MRLSRRSLLASAAVLPAAAGLDRLAAAATPGEAIALYDPALPQARAMAADARAIAVEGDRIRFAREVFARRPMLVRGVTRQGDRVLIEDVGREHGYVPQAVSARGQALEWTLVPR